MPILKLETTIALSQDKRNSLLASLSKTVAEAIGKPEQYVMVTISPAAILMSGQSGEAAFVDIRSIGGLSAAVNKKLAQKICSLLSDSLGVAQNRVYLNFTEVEARNWGWDADIFG